jgi:hypothetical protein
VPEDDLLVALCSGLDDGEQSWTLNRVRQAIEEQRDSALRGERPPQVHDGGRSAARERAAGRRRLHSR